MPFTLTIVAAGKKNADLDEEVQRYVSLMRPWASVSIVTVRSPEGDATQSEKRAREAKLLQAKWPDGSYPIALSEEGRLMSSAHFSQWLEGLRPRRSVTFTIGGAYGLSPQLKEQCKEIISLSPLTLPHKLCMVVLVEQIYRAFTIFYHHPYHK
jgi:23S rRNA (pseudouridine1915-N3)-methyltransferase